MASIINTNLSSLNAQRNLSSSQSSLSTAMQRLSSGLRINSAKDDAAGLAIAERMTSQIRGTTQAARNANDGISLAQTAEGALSTVGNNLQRIRELSVQSANATNSASDRAALQAEVTQLASEIDRVSTQTSFNGINLLDGSFSNKTFQVGATAGQTITIAGIASARSSSLGKYTGFNQTAAGIGAASDTATSKTLQVGSSTVSLGTIANDAKAIAAAMNNSGVSGLVVTANPAKTTGAAFTNTGTSGNVDTLNINGTAIQLTNGGNAGANRDNALAAINAQSASTGVRASFNGTGIDLVADDGRNITTTFTPQPAAAAAGGNPAVVASAISDYGLGAVGTQGGTLNINYNAAPGVSGSLSVLQDVAGVPTAIGAIGGAIGSTGTTVNAIDISTVAGATNALASIDAALDQVNSSRADLGAIQNRFSSTVDNLTTATENVTASRSRIQDADFAAETANLSRAQVLQQAGTAMVAQANQSPQSVLSLLKG